MKLTIIDGDISNNGVGMSVAKGSDIEINIARTKIHDNGIGFEERDEVNKIIPNLSLENILSIKEHALSKSTEEYKEQVNETFGKIEKEPNMLKRVKLFGKIIELVPSTVAAILAIQTLIK
jgi:uncharacterized membrane protein YheB (UPF0754 family)